MGPRSPHVTSIRSTGRSRCTHSVSGSYSPGVAKMRSGRPISSARGRVLGQTTSDHGRLNRTQPRSRSLAASSGIGSGSGGGSSFHFSCRSGGRKNVHSSSGSITSRSTHDHWASGLTRMQLTTHLPRGAKSIASCPPRTSTASRAGRYDWPSSIRTRAVDGSSTSAAPRAVTVKSQNW